MLAISACPSSHGNNFLWNASWEAPDSMQSKRLLRHPERRVAAHAPEPPWHSVPAVRWPQPGTRLLAATQQALTLCRRFKSPPGVNRPQLHQRGRRAGGSRSVNPVHRQTTHFHRLAPHPAGRCPGPNGFCIIKLLPTTRPSHPYSRSQGQPPAQVSGTRLDATGGQQHPP